MTAVLLRRPERLAGRIMEVMRRLKLLAVTTVGDISADVVRRAQEANHAAFRRIVLHYDDRLRALAFRLLEDQTAMDDALQEAYVNAFRSIGRFKGDSGLGTWLHRITYNVCIDHLRKRENVVNLYPDDGPQVQIADSRNSIDDAIVRADIASALSVLPPDQRTAVLLIDAQGWSYEETGKVLGVPTGTVASRVSRARATLRELLEGSR